MKIEDLLAASPEIRDRILRTLGYREREILKLRLGIGDGYSYTLAELSHIFKISPERVSQIEAQAEKKLLNRSLDSFVNLPDLPDANELDSAELKIDVTGLSPMLSLVIDPGTAGPEDIAELFTELSKLYRMVGGKGIQFDLSDSRSFSKTGELV